MLEIKNLHATVGGKEILKGINLTINEGEIHAIMGPNGAGKSTLSYVLAGRDGYEVTSGEVLYKGEDLLELSPDERACRGIFLAFQYPVEIPGVASATFLKTAYNAQRKFRGEPEVDAMEFLKLVREKTKELEIKDDMLKRAVNVGFSGGEKKRNEVLQMSLLEPDLMLLDETDSGLDIDAQDRGGRREPSAQPQARRADHYPLPAPARLYRAGFRPCAGGREDRQVGRQEPRP